jgi:hypothetical protein
MTCYDCERDPCICGDIFPMSRIREGELIYDHNGGLLVDLALEREVAAIAAAKPATHCRMCGKRLRNTRTRAIGECRACHK